MTVNNMNTELASYLVEQIPDDELHIVDVGDVARFIYGDPAIDGAFVLFNHKTAGSEAWSGHPEEMADKFKSEVQKERQAFVAMRDVDVPDVSYSPGKSAEIDLCVSD